MKRLFFLIAVLLSAFGHSLRASSEGPIVVVFRYDDYSSISATDVEKKVVEIFQERNLSCTFSVVPFICAQSGMDPNPQKLIPLTAEKLQLLRDGIRSGTLEVALHGYSHQTIRTWGYFTEFAGLDYTSQRLRLEDGKAFLEKELGIAVTTFDAPFDTFDRHTVRALQSTGFQVFSPNLDEPLDIPRGSTLKFLPATCGITGVRAILQSARKVESQQPFVVVLFHPYDFTEASKNRGRISTDDLQSLVHWIQRQPDMRILSVKQAAQLGDMSPQRLTAFHDRWALRLVPPALQRAAGFPVGVYYLPKLGLSAELWASLSALYLFLACLSAWLALFVGRRLFRRVEWLVPVGRWGSVGLLIVYLVYDFRNWVIRYEGGLIVAVLSGACLGVWISGRIVRREERNMNPDPASDDSASLALKASLTDRSST